MTSQNIDIFFFLLLFFIHEIIIFVYEQKALYRAYFLSVTSDYRDQCPRVGLGSKSRTSYFFFSTSLYSCHLVIPSVYF